MFRLTSFALQESKKVSISFITPEHSLRKLRYNIKPTIVWVSSVHHLRVKLQPVLKPKIKGHNLIKIWCLIACRHLSAVWTSFKGQHMGNWSHSKICKCNYCSIIQQIIFITENLKLSNFCIFVIGILAIKSSVKRILISIISFP
jgi:hypothetical protein